MTDLRNGLALAAMLTGPALAAHTIRNGVPEWAGTLALALVAYFVLGVIACGLWERTWTRAHEREVRR